MQFFLIHFTYRWENDKLNQLEHTSYYSYCEDLTGFYAKVWSSIMEEVRNAAREVLANIVQVK